MSLYYNSHTVPQLVARARANYAPPLPLVPHKYVIQNDESTGNSASLGQLYTGTLVTLAGDVQRTWQMPLLVTYPYLHFSELSSLNSYSLR